MTEIPPARIDALRAFTRFHTVQVGALEEGLYASPLPLPRARALYEIGAVAEPPSAAELARDMRMDEGQLSRILAALEADGLIERQADPADARRRLLVLRPAGREMHDALVAGSNAQAAALLGRLSPRAQEEATAAMTRLRALFGDRPSGAPILRDPKVGELGRLVGLQAAGYHADHGWNGEWEAVALRILADFNPQIRPGRERGWVADMEGAAVGSIFLAEEDAQTARLRLLWVDEAARGMGLGARLIDACLSGARAAGYARMRLWTIDVLVPARKLYAAAGFRLVEATPGRHFGCDVVSETWEITL